MCAAEGNRMSPADCTKHYRGLQDTHLHLAAMVQDDFLASEDDDCDGRKRSGAFPNRRRTTRGRNPKKCASNFAERFRQHVTIAIAPQSDRSAVAEIRRRVRRRNAPGGASPGAGGIRSPLRSVGNARERAKAGRSCAFMSRLRRGRACERRIQDGVERAGGADLKRQT